MIRGANAVLLLRVSDDVRATRLVSKYNARADPSPYDPVSARTRVELSPISNKAPDDGPKRASELVPLTTVFPVMFCIAYS